MTGPLLTIPKLGDIIPNMGMTKRPALAKPTGTSVADALFTTSRQRVLAVLFGNPGRSFYANEIIRLAGVGTGAVQRELASLSDAGLLSVTHIGNQKHFQANASAPVFASLRDLVLKTSGIADILRTALAAFGTAINAAFVYGSVAKREDRTRSDVDLMVISDSLAYAELFAGLEAAAKRLGRPINPTLYSQLEFRRRARDKQAFIVRVLAQPKIWIVGSDDDLAS
jgi:predicted nucleotidyltransferase